MTQTPIKYFKGELMQCASEGDRQFLYSYSRRHLHIVYSLTD